MLARLSSRLTYANVVATLALFVALGGSAVAASLISGKSIKPRSIPGNRLKNHTVTGQQVNLGKLGKVRNAVNADNLGGSPASDYRLHCPAGLTQGGDLCFEPTPRADADWNTALQTCALANRRLPTEGELMLVFNNTGAPQISQWTSGLSVNSGTFSAPELTESASRTVDATLASTSVSIPYRCVTNATN